jgi:hypothetical protein
VGAVAVLVRKGRTLGVAGDTRGAVYVEFLVAFMPLFVLFLATIQLALLTAAKLVVTHAAWSGVRSAVVILEDDPERFDGARRGSLTEGAPEAVPNARDVLAALAFPGIEGHAAEAPAATGVQRGARMVPIRASAYFPLLALAPDARVLEGVPVDDVASSLASELGRRAAAALEYTRAATVVSVHSAPGTDELAQRVGKTAPVTVRVTYAVHCGVPLARKLVCNSLRELAEPDTAAAGDSENPTAVLRRRFSTVESRSSFEELASSTARFVVFEAEATLPNQGAEYESAGSD